MSFRIPGLEVTRDLVRGAYPPFVTGGALPRGDIPVFVFHSLEPRSFEARLRFLSENGYTTLSVAEYYGIIAKGAPAPEKAVLLTFDDGRATVRSVGLPLMKRFGARGVLFLVPGRIVSRPGPLPPTWEEVEAGRATASTILERDAEEDGLLSWEEIADLGRSGLFEFESHTLSHARIHTGPRIVDFARPAFRGYVAMDAPLVREGEGDLLAPAVPLGTPLLESEPRTGEALRFIENPEGRVACRAAVREGGGEAFFKEPGWEERLRGLAGTPAGRYETPEEQREAIARELVEARRLLREHTQSEAVHLCYPWHVSGPTAMSLAREAGYETAFCGKVEGIPITRPGGDPHRIARIGEGYLELLPGRGRASLLRILGSKWLTRLKAG